MPCGNQLLVVSFSFFVIVVIINIKVENFMIVSFELMSTSCLFHLVIVIIIKYEILCWFHSNNCPFYIIFIIIVVVIIIKYRILHPFYLNDCCGKVDNTSK